MDSLAKELAKKKTDREKVAILIRLGRGLSSWVTLTDQLQYAQKALELSKKINFHEGQSTAYF
jgi:hypothetical protein